jgi:hypothetical protein
MIAYLVAAALACDPALTRLFTPAAPRLGRYEVCITAETPEGVAASAPGTDWAPAETLEPSDAFGTAGAYDPWSLARLYRGRRVRVIRGWSRTRDGFESVTLLSPHPDATLTRLLGGTMIITWRSR